MSRIFLVRHAEPAAAWGGDAADPGLSELGRSQAVAAAEALTAYGPLEVVTSPMARCRETAAPYAARAGVEPRIDRAVSEVVAPPGVADRRVWLRETFPWAEGAPRRLWSDVDPGLLAWRDTALAAIAGLAENSVVFSHFIAINAIVAAALGKPETIVFTPAHASITELDVSGNAIKLVRMGATLQSDNVL